MKTQFDEIIGLIPAAGRATRLPSLTGSKEMIPVELHKTEDNVSSRPRVVCEYLLEHMKKAGITKVFMVLREGKWDIPSHFGDGTEMGINLAYLLMGLPYGPPFTLDQAYPFVQHALIALGFPDIVFESDDAYTRLIAKQKETRADVVLGLFPTEQSVNVDMVQVDDDSRVRQIIIKPSRTTLRHTWGIAVWTPVFTRFMHEYLLTIQGELESSKNNIHELHVGDVIQTAIDHGLQVMSVVVSDKPYIDIGLPENLARIKVNISDNR